MNTVCLCGSTRFLNEFQEANIELTKLGLTVITISMAMPKQPENDKEDGLKHLLDLVHLNKILKSDAIVVVGDGYIGESTAREILWATMQGKKIFSTEQMKGSSLRTRWRNIYWMVVGVTDTYDHSAHMVRVAQERLGIDT